MMMIIIISSIIIIIIIMIVIFIGILYLAVSVRVAEGEARRAVTAVEGVLPGAVPAEDLRRIFLSLWILLLSL